MQNEKCKMVLFRTQIFADYQDSLIGEASCLTVEQDAPPVDIKLT